MASHGFGEWRKVTKGGNGEDRCGSPAVPRLTGISMQELNISCQLHLVEKIKEMSLFDLHTLGFLVLKNATKMADIHAPGPPFLSVSAAPKLWGQNLNRQKVREQVG